MINRSAVVARLKSGPAPRARPAATGAWLIWLPAVAVALLALLPISYLLVRALSIDAGAWDLLWRGRTLRLLWQTGGLALAVTASSLLIAVPLAWLTVRTDLPLRRTWAVLAALPLAVPSYVGAYLVIAALGPRGMLQQWLEQVAGVSRLPSIYGFPGAWLVLTLLSYPYVLLGARGALLRLDPALEEAARSLGDGSRATFWHVILPQLRPALASGSLLVALYTLRDFGAVSLMRYETFTRAIYVQYQSAFDRASAAMLSLILVLATLAILALELRTRSRGRYYRSGAGPGRSHPVARLGRWRWPALFFCAAVVSLALVLPAGVLLYWLVRGVQAGERLAPIWRLAGNSLLVSGLAAGATVVAALPVVILSVRRSGRLSRLLEQASYTGFALPGIAIALALVFFSVQIAYPLYQTLGLLILAYGILFIPQAIGALRTSLLQVHPSLEEAARSLGRRPLQVFAGITLPLVRPGVVAAAGLVFLTTMKELPATLILAPLGFTTLATSVWSAVSEAFFARAAAPTLLLVLLSSLPMAYMIGRERETWQ